MKNLSLLLCLLAAALAAQNLAPLKVVLPTVACADLAHAQIGSDIHITEAVEVPDASPAPYCKVSGYVEPEVRFEVRLPIKAWTQRFLQTGCGGLCGNLSIHLSNDSSCVPAQNGELVLASTDMGHNGGMDAAWADVILNSPSISPIAACTSPPSPPKPSPLITMAGSQNIPTSPAVPMAAAKLSWKPSATPKISMASPPARPP